MNYTLEGNITNMSWFAGLEGMTNYWYCSLEPPDEINNKIPHGTSPSTAQFNI